MRNVMDWGDKEVCVLNFMLSKLSVTESSIHRENNNLAVILSGLTSVK